MKLPTTLVIVLQLGIPIVPTFAAAPPAKTWPLSSAARSRLDAVANRQELESVSKETVNLVGQLPAWLLTRLELPPEEEKRQSKAAHEILLLRDKTAPIDRDFQRSFETLVQALQAHLNSPTFRWTLTLFESSRFDASTPGAGTSER